MVQYFAVFIRFSGDNCMTLSRLKLHGNQQDIGVSEGNEKEQAVVKVRRSSPELSSVTS